MTNQASAQVLARAEELMREPESRSADRAVTFEEVAGGRESLAAASGEIKELYRRLKQMEQDCTLRLEDSVESRMPGGKLLKKIFRKLLIAFLAPTIAQQNAINRETVTCLRTMADELRRIGEKQA